LENKDARARYGILKGLDQLAAKPHLLVEMTRGQPKAGIVFPTGGNAP
jgi:hypothetical protein